MTARARWPRRARDRRLVRLGLAVPLVGLTVLAARGGFVSPAHRDVLARTQAVLAGGSDLRGMGAAYPPVPTLLAAVLPGGGLALGVVAALFAALMLHLLVERILASGLPRHLVLALAATVAGVPAVAYLASESLPGVMSLALITVALLGFVRFSAEARTEGVFVAGLALALAFLTSPIALFYAVAVAAAVAVVDPARGRGAMPAGLGVLLFPTLFVAGSWAFLEWRFAGTVFRSLTQGPGRLAFPGGDVLGGLGAAAQVVGQGLLHAPLYAVVAVLVARARPVALVAYLLPLLGSAVTVWVGLLFTEVTLYVFVTILALAAIPPRPGRGARAALLVAALAQLVLAWVWPPSSTGFGEWTQALLTVLG